MTDEKKMQKCENSEGGIFASKFDTKAKQKICHIRKTHNYFFDFEG